MCGKEEPALVPQFAQAAPPGRRMLSKPSWEEYSELKDLSKGVTSLLNQRISCPGFPGICVFEP